jgi:hypothetical protein
VRVDDVGARDQWCERSPNPPRANDRTDPKRAIEKPATAPWQPGHWAREIRVSAVPRRVRRVFDGVSRRPSPVSQLPRQQRICRLVGRQVRCDVKDSHQPA